MILARRPRRELEQERGVRSDDRRHRCRRSGLLSCSANSLNLQEFLPNFSASSLKSQASFLASRTQSANSAWTAKRKPAVSAARYVWTPHPRSSRLRDICAMLVGAGVAEGKEVGFSFTSGYPSISLAIAISRSTACRCRDSRGCSPSRGAARSRAGSRPAGERDGVP